MFSTSWSILSCQHSPGTHSASFNAIANIKACSLLIDRAWKKWEKEIYWADEASKTAKDEMNKKAGINRTKEER
jgi:hypothetical protein